MPNQTKGVKRNFSNLKKEMVKKNNVEHDILETPTDNNSSFASRGEYLLTQVIVRPPVRYSVDATLSLWSVDDATQGNKAKSRQGLSLGRKKECRNTLACRRYATGYNKRNLKGKYLCTNWNRWKICF